MEHQNKNNHDSATPLAPVHPINRTDDKRLFHPNVRKKPGTNEWSKETWDAIKAEYRSGVMLGKLSENYKVPLAAIVTRKQREGWRRDLSKDVRVETMAALAVGEENSALSRLSDEEIISSATRRGVEIVTRHREVLAATLEACSTLAKDLKNAAQAVSGGEEEANLRFLGPRETLAEAALKLGNALARIVPLERKAFGLDDGNDGKPLEDALLEWNAQRAAARESVDKSAGGG